MRFALLASVVALAVTPIAQPTPAGTLRAEIAAFNARNYAAAYTAYTARFKKTCPYATFRKHTAAERALAPGPVTVRVTGVKTTGARAVLAYRILLNGSVVERVKGDTFVRIKGLWYDEVDSQTTC